MAPVQIMMLTTFQDEHSIRLALLAGAEGYMLKSTQVSSMAQQLRALASGTSVVDANVLKALMLPDKENRPDLTPRENDILELVALGCSNREIAEQLFISEGTVRNTLSIILDKLAPRQNPVGYLLLETIVIILFFSFRSNR